MIGLAPDLLFRVSDGQPEINRNAQTDLDSFAPMDGAPLDALRAVLAESRLTVPEGMLEDKRFKEEYFAALDYRILKSSRKRF